MIGSFDNSDVVLAVLPPAERGFRTSNANTGFANIYRGPASTVPVTGTLTNMATNYGYRYNSGKPYYFFDMTDDYVNFSDFSDLASNTAITIFITANLSNVDGINRLFHNDGTVNNYIHVFTNTSQLWIRVGNGVSLIQAQYPISDFFSNNADGTVCLVYDYNAGSSFEDRVKVYGKNGLSVADVVAGSTPTTTSTFTGIKSLGFSALSLGGSIKNAIFCNKGKSATWVSDTIDLGPGLGGLVGTDLTGGQMSLADNKVGLYNPYNNICSLISSAIPRTSNFNTGLIPLVQGESAASTITGTLTNFATGYGFIAKDGEVPAHVLFDGVDDHVNFGDRPELDAVSEYSATIDFETDDVTTAQWLWIKFQETPGKIIGLLLGGSTTLVAYVHDGTQNVTYTISASSLLFNNTRASIGVQYYGAGATNSDRLKISFNGVDITGGTYSGTVPSITQTVTGDLTLGFTSSTISGKVYDFILDSDAKTLDLLKDQYYSSLNEWQGDLSGTEPETPDGTMTLSAEYTYLDAQQCRLGKSGGTVTDYDWGTGRIGEYIRPVGGTNASSETLARFDLSPYSGALRTRLLAYSDGVGTQAASDLSKVYQQNKTAPASWANGAAGPPSFDDFADTAWDTEVGVAVVQDEGSYDYTLTALDGLVSNWAAGNIDQDNGVVIDANYAASGEYNDIFSIKLGVKTGLSAILDRIYRRRRRI